MAKRTMAAVLGILVAVGCDADLDWAGNSSAAVLGPRAMTVLSFVNDQSRATFELLDVDCGLRSDAARNIVVHRDGEPGDADDNLFDTVDELDSVARVGSATISQLELCAETLGYAASSEDLSLLNFLNDQDATTFEQLDDDCGLRSDAARKLIAHRDGGDGEPATADDDLFHSAAEVDAVPRVGPTAMSLLRACAEVSGYGAPGYGWQPEIPECSAVSNHAGTTVTVEDCVFRIHGPGAPLDASVTITFDGHQFDMRPAPVGWYSSSIGLWFAEGYGADHLGNHDGGTTFRITRDPPGALTTTQALARIREQLVVFLREDRIHRPDWQAESPPTWEACLAEGIMEGINGFGDPEWDESARVSRGTHEYNFSGRGPLWLGTRARISKATGEVTWLYVEID
jgi:hypothetical protein